MSTTLYQPRHFKVDELAHALDVMLAHPFATLLTLTDGAPVVSHLPLHVRRIGETLELVGHVAKPNPHGALADGAEATAIFHGGNAFISPRCYTTREAVPTWNYIVVHASGRLRRVDDSAGKELILKTLIDRHDPAYRAQWDDELSEAYRERMKRGIVGLVLEVERVQAKFKLSQNRDPADQQGVLEAMTRGDEAARQLGQWMRRLGLGAPP